MEKVMSYFKGFFAGLVGIMMAIIPVTILWYLLAGTTMFGLDVIGNFMGMVNALGNAGFVGLLSVVFIMYFFLCDTCVKK
jgi:hypothetical protein|tara:strand:- start:2512 stop:2751 length:240 start_codon:yes stop_codon:yes gene_type:complete